MSCRFIIRYLLTKYYWNCIYNLLFYAKPPMTRIWDPRRKNIHSFWSTGALHYRWIRHGKRRRHKRSNEQTKFGCTQGSNKKVIFSCTVEPNTRAANETLKLFVSPSVRVDGCVGIDVFTTCIARPALLYNYTVVVVQYLCWKRTGKG